VTHTFSTRRPLACCLERRRARPVDPPHGRASGRHGVLPGALLPRASPASEAAVALPARASRRLIRRGSLLVGAGQHSSVGSGSLPVLFCDEAVADDCCLTPLKRTLGRLDGDGPSGGRLTLLLRVAALVRADRVGTSDPHVRGSLCLQCARTRRRTAGLVSVTAMLAC